MPTRRSFLKSSIALPAAFAAGPVAIATAQQSAAGGQEPLPTRKLGRNGPEVSMLNIGGMMAAHSPAYLDIAWSMGIRYFDTAAAYKNGQSEKDVGQFFRNHPERRAQAFVVTKDKPKDPAGLIPALDRRLENIGADYVDLFFLHGIGPKGYGEASLEWPKSKEFKEACETIKKSGKARLVGFSCHDGLLDDYLEAAAEGGFVDAIMLAYNPFFEKGDRFDKALDACHKAGIGLVAMKEMRALKQVPQRIPELDKLGLTPHQGILHAVWSDPRIASDCSAMENVQQMEQNTAACRNFKKPLPAQARQALHEAVLAYGTTFCPGCPACADASRRTGFAFRDISRYVTYYEQDGNLESGGLYRALPEAARDPAGFDLAALRDNCQFHIDYPSIVRRAERYFA